MVKPKGTLIAIGGAEDKGKGNKPDIADVNAEFKHFEVIRSFLDNIMVSNPRIEIVPTASDIPLEMGSMYIKVLRKFGYEDADIMNVRDREDANSYEFIKRAEAADAVLFTGGDQFRLTTMLGCSKVMDIFHEKYMKSNFVYAGTSAGAMAMSKVMLYEGHQENALLKGDVRTASGFGLIDHCIIDTHFVNRGRFGRLAQAVVTNPACIGIGLAEDTALIVREGNLTECCGSGMVIIIDGQDIKFTNVAYAEESTPVCIENLRLHILCNGNGFKLKEREFDPGTMAKQDPAKR